jgi:hypothetical protein
MEWDHHQNAPYNPPTHISFIANNKTHWRGGRNSTRIYKKDATHSLRTKWRNLFGTVKLNTLKGINR